MVMEGDLGVNWERFKANFHIYIIARGCTEKPKKVKADVLLHCIGEEANKVVENLEITYQEKEDPDTIITKLDEYFVPKSNTIVDTHKFNSRNQLAGDTINVSLVHSKRDY